MSIKLVKTTDCRDAVKVSVSGCTQPGCLCGIVWLRLHTDTDAVCSLIPCTPQFAREIAAHLIAEADTAEQHADMGAIAGRA